MFSKSNTPPPNKSPIPSDPVPSADPNRFSLIELRKIHQQLFENKLVNDENQNLVIEILRVIAEMVVYGDNKSEVMFDFFCEKNMLALFLEIMRNPNGCPLGVHVQIVQTLSILISCVRNNTSLYYLLSNNYINDIINFRTDFPDDESLGAQFASFLKSLSLRLNEQTVQFFFIEETGAFPLLTRSIELLQHSDPMIRISAQTAILNVYQVHEPRAREFALQEEVMVMLFEGIVKIMKEQLALILKHSNNHIKLQADDKENIIGKVEYSIEDLTITIEDWLYYLQDLLDLKIEVLQHALILYLLNNFITPELFIPIQNIQKMIKEEQYGVRRMSSLEIEDNKTNDDSRKSLCSKSVMDEEENSPNEMLLAVSSLFYLLQISKIINSSMLFRSILVTIFHPLSKEFREIILSSKTNNLISNPFDLDSTSVKSEAENVSGSRHSESGKPSGFNTFRQILQLYFLSTDQPKLILLLTYNFYSILSKLWDFSSFDLENPTSVSKMELLLNFHHFESLHILPPFHFESYEYDPNISLVIQFFSECCNNNIFQRVLKDIPSFVTEMTNILNSQKDVDIQFHIDHLVHENIIELSESPENIISINILNDLEFKQYLEDYFNHMTGSFDDDDSLSKSSTPSLSLESLDDRRYVKYTKRNKLIKIKTLKQIELNKEENPDLLSVEDFLLLRKYYSKRPDTVSLIEICLKVLKQSQSYSLTVIQFTIQIINNLVHFLLFLQRNLSAFIEDNPSYLKSSTLRQSYCESYNKYVDKLMNMIQKELSEAAKNVSYMLLARIDHAKRANHDGLIILINEEFMRFQGRDWKIILPRMLSDRNLALPYPSLLLKMGIDFEVPISQFEIGRKEIQTYLLTTELIKSFKPLQISSFSKNSLFTPPHPNEFLKNIDDTQFLLINEKNIVPSGLSEGSNYDMKGKKFLDTIAFKPIEDLASNSSSPSPSSSIWSTSASVLTLGLLGSRKSDPKTPPIKEISSKKSSKDAENRIKLLFIQDPNLLILINPAKIDGKSTFKVFVAAPLLYSDAKVDSTNRKKFKIIIRSWHPLQNLSRIDTLSEETADSNGPISPSSQSGSQQSGISGRKSEGFLKSALKSQFYEITLQMDSEQGSMLAVQHIESRRLALTQLKLNQLASTLKEWTEK